MNREERKKELLQDMKRGLNSITIDAFAMTKKDLGVVHYLSTKFRKRYQENLNYCRRYFMKDKNGARYGLVNASYMFQQLKRGL